MSNTTYYNPNSELCLEVRQWILDNPQDDSNVPSPATGFQDGVHNMFYGKKHTKESKKQMSESSKGCVAWNKGKKMSPESRKKLSNSCKGRVPWNKGIPHSTETKKKIGELASKRIRERNPLTGQFI